MVKESKAAKKNGKKTSNPKKDNLVVLSKSDWQAYILFPGSVSDTTHVVPARYVENLQPPVFDPEKLYDIFWSPDPALTLEDLRKTKTEIPRFPEKSADSDAGYYKGYVLLLEVSAEAMEQALRQKEVRRTLAKRKGATSNSSMPSSSSKDSGISIVSRVSLGKGLKRGNNGDELAEPPRKSSLMEQDVASDYEAADEDLNEGIHSNGAPATQYERKIKELTAKLSKAKSKLFNSEEKIARLEKLNISLQEHVLRLEKLNFSFQEHVLECMKIVPCKCQVPEPPKPAISGASPAVGSPGPTSNQVGTKQKAAAGNDRVHVSTDPVAGPSFSPTPQGIKPRESQGAPTTSNPVETQDLTVIALNDSDMDKLVSVQEVIIDDPELGALLQEYDANFNQPTQQAAPAVEQIIQPTQQAAPTAEQVLEEHLEDIQFGPEPRPENWVDAPEMVEIYPTVFIDKRVWQGTFKMWVEHPVKNYNYGKKGDIEFIKDGAMHVWGSDKLKAHSISGKQSNANLKKKPDAAPPGPPLPPHEIDAIIGALKRRVLLEQLKPVPEGVQPCNLRLDERCSPAAVKYEIGQKRISLLRMMKKKQ